MVSTYREWVGPPPSWWVLSGLFSLSWFIATFFYFGPLVGGAAFLGSQLIVSLFFLLTAVRLELTDTELRVARAVLELAYVGDVRALDAADAAARTGPDADARAHLVLRSHTKTAVELTLDDPADPVPYWVVSTRHPLRLAEAVRAALTTGSARVTP